MRKKTWKLWLCILCTACILGKTGIQTGAEQELETQMESETEVMSEWTTEPETLPESEPVSEPESESETERRLITVMSLEIDSADGTKIYDGTTHVDVRAEVVGLPEGMTLELCGEAVSPDAGVWEVQTEVRLAGEGSEFYELVIETENPVVEIVPRPLVIEIDDAVKTYFTENRLEELEFLHEWENPIRVSGFVEQGVLTENMPEGFVFPELCIDEEILKKESPMYENQEVKVYEKALAVRVENGIVTGDPTPNYCFVTEPDSEYYHPGSVMLRAPEISIDQDYTVSAAPQSAMCVDERGMVWLRNGASLNIQVKKGSGFTDCIIYQTAEDGVEFTLCRYGKGGEVLAESEKQKVYYQLDADAPWGVLSVEGRFYSQEETLYVNRAQEVSLEGVTDEESGVYEAALAADYDLQWNPQDPASMEQIPWERAQSVYLQGEGACRVYARLEDRTGNVRYLCSPLLILDFTEPELEIRGVEAGSANAGKMTPEIICRDRNYREGSLTVEYEGYRGGVQTFSQERELLENGEQIRFADIPHERGFDDLYVMRILAEDLAGNSARREIVFSVNRFGSVYAVEEECAVALENYYLREAVAVVLREVNVDFLAESNLYVSFGGQMRMLEKGRDYQVETAGDEHTWKEYRYTLGTENFQEDGVYRILATSRDRAENLSDNRRQSLDLEFAVDRTAPSILISGIADGESYAGQEREIEIECSDNLALAQVEVWKNGELYSRGCEETQTIRVTAKEDWQTIEVSAVDRAGNAAQKKEVQFYLGEENEKPPARPAKPSQKNTGDASKAPGGEKVRAEEARLGKLSQAPAEHLAKPVKSRKREVFFGALGLGFAVLCLKTAFFHKNLRVK